MPAVACDVWLVNPNSQRAVLWLSPSPRALHHGWYLHGPLHRPTPLRPDLGSALYHDLVRLPLLGPDRQCHGTPLKLGLWGKTWPGCRRSCKWWSACQGLGHLRRTPGELLSTRRMREERAVRYSPLPRKRREISLLAPVRGHWVVCRSTLAVLRSTSRPTEYSSESGASPVVRNSK